MRVENLIPMTVLLVASGHAWQNEPLPKPSFSVAITTGAGEFKLGAAIPINLILTNTSGSDLRYSVKTIYCPPPVDIGVAQRQVQVMLYDEDKNLVPLTQYGALIQGKTGPVALPPEAVSRKGVGCGGGGTRGELKPGESKVEQADLNKDFDLKKPGKYTMRAQRLDDNSKTLVKSDVITITLLPKQ